MNEPTPEFSRVIFAARIPPKGLDDKLEAKPSERKALAKRFDLIEIPKLEASLSVVPGERGSLEVKGTLHADVVQRCCVTLEPLPESLDLDIDLALLPAEAEKSKPIKAMAGELEDEVEFFFDGKIDLGEIVAQTLGINLDPYPRKPDAALTKTEFGPKPDNVHPFAALRTKVKSIKNKEK